MRYLSSSSPVSWALFDKPATAGEVRKLVISLYVAAGLAAGAVAEFNYASAIDPLLLFLLFIAGIDMAHVEIRLDRSMFLAPLVALLAAGVVGPLFALFFRVTPAVALGLGWYSFTGPYLACAGGAAGGAYGLLVNFLREQLTFLLAPPLAKRLGKLGVLTMGGALRLLLCPLRVCQRRTSHGRSACGGSAYTPAIHLDATHPLKFCVDRSLVFKGRYTASPINNNYRTCNANCEGVAGGLRNFTSPVRRNARRRRIRSCRGVRSQGASSRQAPQGYPRRQRHLLTPPAGRKVVFYAEHV